MKIKKFDYHRNGIFGDNFYCAIIENDGRDMFVVYFPNIGQCACAVFDSKLIGEGTIEFLQNSWRGDHFAGIMQEEIDRRNGGSH